MDAYREGGEREKEREQVRACTRASLRSHSSTNVELNYSASSLLHAAPVTHPRPASRNRWWTMAFFPPFLSTRVSGPRFSKRSKGKSRERLLCWAVTASSARPEKRKTLVGRKVFGRVMNLQIPWNGACYSLVAAVASARNRMPISLSLSVLDFQRSLPTPPPARLRNGNCVCEKRGGGEGLACFTIQRRKCEKLLLGQLYFNQFKGCSGLNGN